jgi:hypothetical protein
MSSYEKIEVDGQVYSVAFESNTIPGKVDAVVVEEEDDLYLENERENVGDSYSVDAELVDQNPSAALDRVEEQLLKDRTEDEQNKWAVEALGR